MTGGGGLRRHSHRPPSAPAWWLIIPLVGLLACSATTRERLAQVLFDDPPSRGEEDAEAAVEAPVVPAAVPRPTPSRARWQGSTHGPYAARLCQGCHIVTKGTRSTIATGSLLRHPRTELCQQCHGDNLLSPPDREAGAALHGPVAAGLCLACHLPHRSREPFLLRSPVAGICDGCHPQANLLPDHPGEERACLECHDPHTPDRISAS